MPLEIERKFLVSGDFSDMVSSSSHITQAYITKSSGKTVRVRIRDDKAYLTIKGKSTTDGLSRYEWEKEISTEDAKDLLELAEPGVIDKCRHIVNYKGHIFEVDEFFGENKGLIIAEVELASSEEHVELPPFIGKEVTGDRRYYNSSLTNCPYSKW